MLSLKSFHTVLVAVSIGLTSGFAIWALLNDYVLLGGISFTSAVLLSIYARYVLSSAQRVHLE
jgi:hypothetical protein